VSIVFITGGVRSGKSAFAERLAREKGDSVLYIATGVNTDAEMEQRILLHRTRRPAAWGLLEVPYDVPGSVSQYEAYDTVLFDCVSTWVTNLLLEVPEEKWRDKQVTEQILRQVKEWGSTLRSYPGTILIVSSETGLGGIALSRLGRWFQDVLGEANQHLAEQADDVYAVLSGIPVKLKGASA
jgi:adenosylcobinamide kinase / adenosylcobinamide-phosphate guanylyltransferase